ncbi:MAG TPA: type II secretion system protein [Terriglobales bacterium]|nr:type II secretion system protein [Terriglobales bacterium]
MIAFCATNAKKESPRLHRPLAHSERGFTLLETLVAVSVFLVVAAIGFSTLGPAIRDARINGAYNLVLEQMRQARALAVQNRKTYLLTFNPAGLPPGIHGVQINQLNGGAVGAIYHDVPVTLPTDVHFQVLPGVPNTNATAPDNLGAGSPAIQFDIGVSGGTLNQIYFFPDGSARDINNNINNGIVYIARDGDLYSSHAITLFGAAGRVRGWRLYPPSGVSGAASWSQQ